VLPPRVAALAGLLAAALLVPRLGEQVLVVKRARR
jgi:hypothetical protein